MKIETVTTCRTPLRCKLERDKKIVQQEVKLKFLGIEISG